MDIADAIAATAILRMVFVKVAQKSLALLHGVTFSWRDKQRRLGGGGGGLLALTFMGSCTTLSALQLYLGNIQFFGASAWAQGDFRGRDGTL